MNRRRPLGWRRPPAQERERRAAHEVAQFIASARACGLSNSALLIEIDRRWPWLSARELIAGHFLELSRRKERAQ